MSARRPEVVEKKSVYRFLGPPELELWAETLSVGEQRYVSHQLVAQSGQAGVVIIPVTLDGAVLLVRQWRQAIGVWAWELPRGFGGHVEGGNVGIGTVAGSNLDPDRDAEPDIAGDTGKALDPDTFAAASRELAEETGLAGELRSLGTIYPDSGLLAGSVEVFEALIPAEAVAAADLVEIQDLRWLSLGELAREVASGEISDGITLAALALWSFGQSK